MSINKAPQKVPKLRFKGFTDDWEQRKLGGIADVKDSARISNELWVENGIPYLRSSDLVNGELNGELFISNDTYEKYASKTGAPQKDDVLFTSGGKVGIVYHKMDDSPVYVQGGAVLYVKTSTSVLLEGSFLSVYFSSPKMQLYLDIASSGGTIKHFTLKPANSSPIVFPSISEQSKIGQFFKTLDDTITLHQRKLDQLNQLKQALLQQMFPGKGETVPKLRFAGFEGDWEENKLGQTDTYFTDGNYGEAYPSANDMSTKENGGVPFLRGSNFLNGYLDEANANYIKIEKHYELASGHIQEDDIILAVRGSLGTLGYATKQNVGWNINSQLAILRTKKSEIWGMFLTQYLLSHKGQKEMFSRITGTALKQLPIKQLKTIPVPIPNISEQKHVGLTFKQLDTMIALNQRKLDQLKNIKQVLLQNMFI